jgi:hypothetical protein
MIAPATVQYILYQLITQYGKNANVTHLVDSMDWYTLPCYTSNVSPLTFSVCCVGPSAQSSTYVTLTLSQR